MLETLFVDCLKNYKNLIVALQDERGQNHSNIYRSMKRDQEDKRCRYKDQENEQRWLTAPTSWN